MSRRIAMYAVLFAVLCLAPGAAPAGQRPVTLKAANIHAPSQPYTLALQKWGELLEKETNGQIKVAVFPSGSVVANQLDSYSQVKIGTVDASIMLVVKDDVPGLQIIAFPYAFRDYQSWRDFMDGDFIAAKEKEYLEKTGIRILGAQYLGARHLTANKAIRKPEELGGMKLRAIEMPVYMDMVRGLGALATPVAFPEVLQALKTGIVDGQENPIPTIYQQKYYEAQKYVMLTSHLLGGDFWVMNEKKFQSFPKEQQEIILRTAKEAIRWGEQLLLAQEKELIEKLKQNGMTIVGPEDGLDIDAFMKSVRQMYPKYEAELGKDVLDRVTGR